MILPTMTPEEKVRQASRLELDIRLSARSWVEHNQRLLKMRKSYPFVHVIKRDFKEMGIWNIIISFQEKPNFRKGFLYSTNAYQKYYVCKGTKAENIGAGVYFFGGSPPCDGMPGNGTTFYELTPHFFNRYRQRYLAVNGMEGISFNDLFLKVYEDINIGISPSPDILDGEDFGDKWRDAFNIPRISGYDNLVMFIRHGLCLGFSSRRGDYQCFLTYIGRNEFFRWQSDLFDVSNQLLDVYDKMLFSDPYYMVDKERFRTSEIQRELSKKLLLP